MWCGFDAASRFSRDSRVMGVAVLVAAPNFSQGNGVERLPYSDESLERSFVFTCPYCGWQGERRTLKTATTIIGGQLTVTELVVCGKGHEWTIADGEMTSLSIRPNGDA